MVQRTLPSTRPSSGRFDADWQPFGLVAGPEGVLFNGGVTYLGARIVRILPLKGKFGGFFWGTDQPVDVESTVNTSGNDRIDRLVIQYESGLGNRPVVVPGVASATPAVPDVTQNLITEGNGQWQVPLAHWTVGRNSGPISNLVYESRYPTRQEVPFKAESGAQIEPGTAQLLATMRITPFYPRSEIECETTVFVKCAGAAAGIITVQAAGQTREQEFAVAGNGTFPIKVMHRFYVGNPGEQPIIVVATAEGTSPAFGIGRIISLNRELAV